MIFVILICTAAAAYQLLAILACLRHRVRTVPRVEVRPGVSILKPVRGADQNFYDAIRTHALIAYPEFEILVGIRDPKDEAWTHIERLRREFPAVNIRAVQSTTAAPNAKVGVLEDLLPHARFAVLVVNDADIAVPSDYLQTLMAELQESGVGLVTCLYRASAGSFAATLEALGVATDFAPGALIAPLVGVRAFGLGSTLAFRRDVFERAGGFRAIRNYLADDYQIGKRISETGLNVRISRMPVSTHLSGSWSDVWLHQVRWARTIRVSQTGYFGLPITYTTVWALLAIFAGLPGTGVSLIILRLVAGLVAGVAVLDDPVSRRWWWLIPVRDAFAAVVWIAGAFGNSVSWSGRKLRLDREGRIVG